MTRYLALTLKNPLFYYSRLLLELIQMDIEILSKLKVTTKCGKIVLSVFLYVSVCVCVQ